MTVIAGEVWTNEPSTYGLINYGENLYGETAVPSQLQTVPPTYVIEPFTAQSLNYGSVGVSWARPQATATRWRLLSNRYGPPADENDGNVLIDSIDWLGNFFLDQAVIPGTYMYYGVYAQTNATTNTWVRCGVTGCMTVADNGTADWLSSRLPVYFTKNLGGSLTQDATGNQFLQQFLQVLAWGIDYVQTQYNNQANHLNDPMAIPVDELVNLATQLGLPYDPMISVYLMRKAAANWAHVAKERGTVLGIANQLSLLTGWSVDLQTGPNLMLEQDQSWFPDPSYPAWNSTNIYHVGEIVTHGSYLYSCLIAQTVGTAPPAGASSNANWQLVQDAADPSSTLSNSNTGGINTWEAIYPAQTNGTGPAGSFAEGVGMPNPSAITVWQSNTLKLTNKEATAQDMYARSISRTSAQITAGGMTTPFTPDQLQAINDGIPVPFTLPNQLWSSKVRYPTGSIVTYGNLPFLALRASTNAQPQLGTVTPEWTPLANDPRLRLMVSGGTMAGLGGTAVPVTPFVEWYDIHGNLITRLTARTPTAGTPGIPDQLAFDAFVRNPATTIAGRHFDNAYVNTWTAQDNDFTISGYNGGVAYPNGSGVRSVALTTGQANCQVGVTFQTFAGGGQQQGIVFRWSSETAYWKATPGWLVKNNAGTWTAFGYGGLSPTQALTGQASTFEGGLANWVSTGVDTLSLSTTTAHSGSDSMAMTSTGAGNMQAGHCTSANILAQGIPCVENQPVTIDAYFEAAATPRTCKTGVQFYTAAGASIITDIGGSVTDAVGSWTHSNFTAVAPAGAAWCRALTQVNGVVGSGEVHNVDDVTVSLGQTVSANPGDRMVVQMNGSSITVLINGVQVASVTDAFNSTATQHGMIVE